MAFPFLLLVEAKRLASNAKFKFSREQALLCKQIRMARNKGVERDLNCDCDLSVGR
jgi:hypothetical protein